MPGSGLNVQGAKETSKISAFIRRVVKEARAEGVVVGLSGGIDSSVVGALCVRALGKERVLALLLPSDHTPPEDVSDAKGLASEWGVRNLTVHISPIVQVVLDSAKAEGTRIAKANVEARVRMTIEYYHANSLGYLVAGTDDRSENALGFFTKWGDGGVDFLPISHLYKTQVRKLGLYLGLPQRVVDKPASPQLWPGHRATDEIPADYDKVDVILHTIFDLKRGPVDAARAAGVSRDVVDKVLRMNKRSAHKRTMPPSLA